MIENDAPGAVSVLVYERDGQPDALLRVQSVTA